MQMISVEKKDNGFLLTARIVQEDDEQLVAIGTKNIVVEGKDPKKLGEAVLKMFEKPRGPRKREGTK